MLGQAIQLYRENFQPSIYLDQPYVSMGVPTAVADTDEEAEYLATSAYQRVLGLMRGESLKLKAPVLKGIIGVIGERDDAAEICRDSNGDPEPDSELNDTENVPLLEPIETYFAREVTPHVPDAWIDRAYCDAKDGHVGRVGYEIPFNRNFYVFQPPRTLRAIDTDLKTVTDRILAMIGGLTK